MSKQGFILNLLIIISYSASCQDSTVSKINIGNANVNLKSYCLNPCASSVTYINLHENENTSVQAAQQFLKEHGGQLVQLNHTGNRNINFSLNKKPFAFDPNRMFTPIGRKETLTNLSKYNDEAATAMKPLADEILKKHIDGKKLVVALHNNTDSAFSILSYTVFEQEGGNAAKVFINDAMDSDDFILTTDSTIFKSVQEQGINVVLQSSNAKDDGSLSVYAYNKNIPYINIEAQHGHIEEQTRMMYALKGLLQQYR